MRQLLTRARGRSWSAAVLVPLGLALAPRLLSAQAQAAVSKPWVIVLADSAQPQAALSAETFVTVLDVQLEPYGLRAIVADRRRADAPDDSRAAIDAGRTYGARAVVWYGASARSAERVSVFVYDAQSGELSSRDFARVARAHSLERSVAAWVRTLLTSELAPLRTPASAPARARDAAPSPESAPATPRLMLLANSTLEAYPEGESVRLGPDLGVAVGLHRIQGALRIGYRLPRDGGAAGASWSASALALVATLDHAWPLGARWSVLAGGRVQWNRLRARAVSASVVDATWLDELALSASGTLRVELGAGLAAEALLHGGWLALAHRLSVRGEAASRSGRAVIGGGLGVCMGLF